LTLAADGTVTGDEDDSEPMFGRTFWRLMLVLLIVGIFAAIVATFAP